MKNFVWIAAALLVLSFIYPNGPTLPVRPPVPQPAPAPAPVVDERLAALLAKADAADKQRIADVYNALIFVLRRDAGARVTTTEQWADLAANTLQLAIETPGKYPGVDTAIESVFLATVGTDDVLPNNPDTQQKLIAACEIVVNSASR